MQRQIKIISDQQTEQAYYTNLPAPPTPLIGREQVLKDAQQLLLRSDVRLLTFVGTAGIGKTRLSLQVAANVAHTFADGVVFISLAPINDPTLVIPTIAQAFSLQETGKQSSYDLLAISLQDRQLLLILDNFEQVIAAAPQIAELLAVCPQLKMIVTSREVLRIRQEQQFSVSPLALPDIEHLPDISSLAEYAAVALFVQTGSGYQTWFYHHPGKCSSYRRNLCSSRRTPSLHRTSGGTPQAAFTSGITGKAGSSLTGAYTGAT